jgi:hypothetical protein
MEARILSFAAKPWDTPRFRLSGRNTDQATAGWNRRLIKHIISSMDDTPHPSHAADCHIPTPSEAELLAALEESQAEAEAGLLVSGDEILRELHESIARMEGREAAADRANEDPGSSHRR